MSAAINGREPRTVKLSEVEMLDETNPRASFNRERAEMFAENYAENGPNAAPPITVAESEGRLILIGGRHRIAGAKQAGLDELPAIVTALSPGVDPIATVALLAAEEDSRSSLPLTSAEKRAICRIAFRRDPSVSKKELARILATTEAFVTRALDDDYQKGVPKAGAEENARETAKKLVNGMVHARKLGILDNSRLASEMPERIADAFDSAFGAENDHEYIEVVAGWFDEAAGLYNTQTESVS